MAEEQESFEKHLERLQEIVEALERETLPLDQGMKLYREGMACSQICQTLLKNAKHELTILKNGEHQPLELKEESEEEPHGSTV